jgi:hypothetical protein
MRWKVMGLIAAVTDKLNSADANSFTPSLNQLDALIQSILVTP